MAINTFFGAWNPTTNVLPDTVDLDFGAWFISETGTIDDITYNKGDWLIYICEARGTLNERSLWRMTNGVVLFNLDNHQNVPEPGYYTKVRLDNAGNIIDAGDLEYDDLPKEATDKFNLLSDDNIKKNVTGNVPFNNKPEWNKNIPNIANALNPCNDFIMFTRKRMHI